MFATRFKDCGVNAVENRSPAPKATYTIWNNSSETSMFGTFMG